MYIVDRYRVEEVLAEGGQYIEEFEGYRVEVKKAGNKLKISGTNIKTNVGFNLPNITGITTYEEVQEVINRNMIFIQGDVIIKQYNHLMAYRLTGK